MTKNTDVVKVEPAGALVPDFIRRGDTRGAEQIQNTDLRMPRLALAQGLSPELDPTSPKYVKGLVNGDVFNNLTGEIYIHQGESVEVVVVRAEKTRFIEFNPREAGGGVRDRDVPVNDPRTKFTKDVNGDPVKPIATKFMEYVALLLRPSLPPEPIVLSFKGSGLGTAGTLSTLIKLAGSKHGGVPAFAFVYRLTATTETKPQGKYAAFALRLVGPVDESTYNFAGAFYDSILDKVVETEREHPEGEDKDIPF